MYITGPLALLMMLALTIYSHAAIPSAYKSLSQFFSNQEDDWLTRGEEAGINKDQTHILSSELASPLVSEFETII